MDPAWLLLLLPLSAASGWVMAYRDQRAKREPHRLPPGYFQGLNFLLNEQPDRALEVFMEIVEIDQETIEIHLALGNLFRRRGEVERAIRIHQSLIERKDLSDSLRTLALFELGQDYYKAGLLDRAEQLFQELYRLPDQAEAAGQFLLKIYDREKDWPNAIRIAERLPGAPQLNIALAHYHCELAERAIAEGRVETALQAVDRAFEHDPHCLRAVIQSGRVAALKGHHRNAIAIWRGIEHWAPAALGEVVPHLANSYMALGQTSEFEQFLRATLAEHPEPRVIEALLEAVCDSRDDGGGRDLKAAGDQPGGTCGRDLLLEIARKHPSPGSLHVLLEHRKLLLDDTAQKQWIPLADLLYRVLQQERGYACSNCGLTSSTLHWQCPGCQTWDSMRHRASIQTGLAEATSH